LSDLGAGLVGGLGLAASANLHPGRAGLFEPVHGSAPPLVGKGIANPMAAVLTGALMFEQLGHPEAARDLEGAVKQTIAAGVRTRDIGGSATTNQVAKAIARELERGTHDAGPSPRRACLVIARGQWPWLPGWWSPTHRYPASGPPPQSSASPPPRGLEPPRGGPAART